MLMDYSVKITKERVFEIIVAGGGVAGFCAAVAAARSGKKTALIEDAACLGGALTWGGNPEIGIFYANHRQVISGIGWEFCKRLEQKGFAKIPDFSKDLDNPQSNVHVDRAMAENLMNEMCEESGCKLFLHTKIVGALKDKTSITAVICAEKGGLCAFKGQVFIDCTGDGDLSALAGADYEISAPLQPATFGYTFTPNNIDNLDENEVRAKFDALRRENKLLHGDFWPEYHAPILNFFKEQGNNANHIDVSSCDAEALTSAEIAGRKAMARMLDFASGVTPINIYAPASAVAYREGRRIIGDYTITEEDYVTSRIFDDAVCHSYYAIDLHTNKPHAALKNKAVRSDTAPTVPYRALIVKGFKNLLVAGRCASADQMAMSALRVKASCMAMGQAAGTAAALAAQGDVRKVPLDTLKAALKSAGAIVP